MAGLVACATLALPAAASANDFQTVYNNYKKHGTIKPCTFSEQQLRNAARETPPDVEQYAPSFLDAVASAREAAASCHKQATAAPTAAPAASPPPTASTPTPTPPTASAPTATPAPATTAQPVATATVPAPTPPAAAANAPVLDTQRVSHDSSAPAAIWVLVLLAGLVVLAALSAAAAWWYGYAPAGMGRPRLEDTGHEFGDWLRFGV